MRKIKLFAVIAVTSLCSGCALYEMRNWGDGSGQISRSNDNEKLDDWCTYFPYYIIPRICEYHQLHPERFKATGKGEEIQIEGLMAFVKDDAYFKSESIRCSIWAGAIRDAWGQEVHFVQDLNADGFIDAAGERRKVEEVGVYKDVKLTNREHHFGILKVGALPNLYDGYGSRRIIALTFRDARRRQTP
jgi:hypothetical protein